MLQRTELLFYNILRVATFEFLTVLLFSNEIIKQQISTQKKLLKNKIIRETK